MCECMRHGHTFPGSSTIDPVAGVESTLVVLARVYPVNERVGNPRGTCTKLPTARKSPNRIGVPGVRRGSAAWKLSRAGAGSDGFSRTGRELAVDRFFW